MRILLVDDHPLFRQGVLVLIRESFPEAVFIEAGTVSEARELMETQHFTVAVLDISLPDADGLSLAEELLALHEPPRVYILSMHRRSALIARARDIGCCGYFLKEGDGAALLGAIADTRCGFRLSSNLADLLNPSSGESQIAELYGKLTRREKEIFRLFASGLGYKEVAWQLGISPRTASVHRYNTFRKLKVLNDVDMVRAARELGLVV